MRRRALFVARILGLLTGMLSASDLAWAEAAGAGCPPEEQAVLAAYQQCAAFYTQRNSADRAATLDGHAVRLRNACDTDTSAFIDADPYQDLLDCAQAMAEAGQVTQARAAEPVAQAYRAEQMRRLLMHGGDLLDPARYMGRPSDDERRRETVGPVTERITTPELSAGKPKGGGWKLLTGERMPVVYWKDPVWMSTRPVKGQNIDIVLTMRSTNFALSIGAEDFPAALEKLLRRSVGKRSRIVSISATHAREPADYCARYVMMTEDESTSPGLDGVIVETSAWGFACLERSSKFVIQAYYDESKPRSAPTAMDDVVRGEAEAFLQDISFEPKR